MGRQYFIKHSTLSYILLSFVPFCISFFAATTVAGDPELQYPAYYLSVLPGWNPLRPWSSVSDLGPRRPVAVSAYRLCVPRPPGSLLLPTCLCGVGPRQSGRGSREESSKAPRRPRQVSSSSSLRVLCMCSCQCVVLCSSQCS